MSEKIDYVKVIKSKISILDLVTRDIKVIRSGSSLKALCPFHKEKTPSFTINETKESYRCFGCGKAGDIFSYVMPRFVYAIRRIR